MFNFKPRKLLAILSFLGLAAVACGSIIVGATNYELTVTTAGTGSGNVSGPGIDCDRDGTPGDCAEIIQRGKTANITCTSDDGGDCLITQEGCNGTSCNLSMSTPRGILVTFNPPVIPEHNIAITMTGTGGGTVTCTNTTISCTGPPNAGTCEDNVSDATSVTCTGTPDAGSNAVAWSGDCTGGGTCDLGSVTSDKAVSATFNATTAALSCAGATGFCTIRDFEGTTAQTCNASEGGYDAMNRAAWSSISTAQAKSGSKSCQIDFGECEAGGGVAGCTNSSFNGVINLGANDCAVNSCELWVGWWQYIPPEFSFDNFKNSGYDRVKWMRFRRNKTTGCPGGGCNFIDIYTDERGAGDPTFPSHENGRVSIRCEDCPSAGHIGANYNFPAELTRGQWEWLEMYVDFRSDSSGIQRVWLNGLIRHNKIQANNGVTSNSDRIAAAWFHGFVWNDGIPQGQPDQEMFMDYMIVTNDRAWVEANGMQDNSGFCPGEPGNNCWMIGPQPGP